MSLPTRFGRNALSNYGAAFASLLVALLVTPLLVRGLGKTAYGVWGLATSTVLYFDLLKFGFGRATVRYVAASMAVGDVDKVRRTIATSSFALMIPGALVVLLSPVMALAFPLVFDVPADLKTAAMVIVVLSAVDLAFAIPSDAFGSSLIGLQRYDLLNITLVGTSLAQAIAWAIVLALGGGLIGIGVATLAFSLTGQASRYVLTRRLVGAGLLRPSLFERTLVRPLLSMSGWIAVNEFSDTLIARVDAALVGFINGVPQAAVYLVGQKLAALGDRMTNPVAALFYPHASGLAATDDHAALTATVYTGTRISLAIATPLLLVLAVVAAPALQVWVGPGYSEAVLVVVLLSGAQVVNTVPRTLVYVLRGMGLVRVPALLGLLEAGVNFGLSITFALSIGLEGVALGTLIGAVLVKLGMLLPYCARKARIPLRSLLWVAGRANLPPAGAAIAVGLLVRGIGGGDLVQLALGAAATLGTYAAVLSVTGLSAAERARVVEIVRSRRGRLASQD